VCLGTSVSLFFIHLASGMASFVSLFGFGFGFRPVHLLGRALLGKLSHLPERYSGKYSNYVCLDGINVRSDPGISWDQGSRDEIDLR
jgi:hypothetical protein